MNFRIRCRPPRLVRHDSSSRCKSQRQKSPSRRAHLAMPSRLHYLEPYSRGEISSEVAITEAGAGSDVAGISTTAVRRNGSWVLNGRKKWIGKADWADFLIVVAVTDP
jgi:hypothetical protein